MRRNIAISSVPPSTIYTSSNYYHAILEMLPEYRERPPALRMLYVPGAGSERA